MKPTLDELNVELARAQLEIKALAACWTKLRRLTFFKRILKWRQILGLQTRMILLQLLIGHITDELNSTDELNNSDPRPAAGHPPPFSGMDG